MLDPIPGLEFFDDIHRYRLNGSWLARSVTGVIGHDMSPVVRKRIDQTKHEWEPRGNACHAALEAHLLGLDQPDPGVYADWITPLLVHPLWQGVEVVAVEYRLCDASKSLGGTPDFLLRTAKGSLCLGDLKSVGNAPAAQSRKPATEQLGAGVQMLSDHHPFLRIDKCLTVVVGPGAVRVKAQEPDECLQAWLDCWDQYRMTLPDF